MILRDEQRALVAISFIFSVLLGPALFYFYQTIFKDQSSAFAGALLCSFAPNVWVYSCAGRSDSPALVLGTIALTLVLKGAQSRRLLWLGCVVLGLGAGVRVSLLPLVAPTLGVVWVIWLRRREWRVVLWAAIILIVCLLAWYIPMVWHQTWDVYNEAVSKHRQYIWSIDSIVAANHNRILSHRLARFFIDIWGAEWIMHVTYTLAALGLLTICLKRRWQLLGWMLVAFIPYAIFAFSLNAPLAASLYSLPYIPFFAGLAAYGAVMLPRLIFGVEPGTKRLEIGLPIAVIVTIAFAGWSYPIIKLLHSQASPPLRAMHYVQKNLDPTRDVLIYDQSLEQHVGHYLPGFRASRRAEQMSSLMQPYNSVAERPNLVYITETPIPNAESLCFAWEAGKGSQRLAKLSLGRYFDICITRLRQN
jgi:4-amino-4-deoxy-L-arabinose transferase-like glycosyltransferase